MKRSTLPLLGLGLCLAFSACTLPLAETAYGIKKTGIADTFFDGFEDNDGTNSTAFYYSDTAGAKVSTTWKHSGSYSLKFETAKTLTFTVNPAKAATLSFYSNRSFTTDSISSISGQLKVDGASATGFTSTTSGSDNYISLSIPAGSHIITITGSSYVTYIDNLQCVYAASDLTPLSGAYLTTSPSFSWPSQALASAYDLQIGTDSSLASPTYEYHPTSAAYAPTANLSNGVWYWRYRAKSGESYGAWSPTMKFIKGSSGTQGTFSVLGAMADAWTLSGSVTTLASGSKNSGLALQFSSNSDSASLVFTASSDNVLCLQGSQPYYNYTIKLDGTTVSPVEVCTQGGWYDFAIPNVSAGVHTLAISSYSTYKIGGFKDLAYATAANLDFETSGPEALGGASFGDSSSGITSTDFNSGARSYKLATSSQGSSAIILPVTLASAKTISLYIKCSNSALIFYLSDGSYQFIGTCPTYWSQVTRSLSAGNHCLIFKFAGTSASTGFLDDITFY